jgi:hypothetical protein
MEGESGPKTRPTGVVDGKQVNIPVLSSKLVPRDGAGDVGRGRLPIREGWWTSVKAGNVLTGRTNNAKSEAARVGRTQDLRCEAGVLTNLPLLLVILPRKARTTVHFEAPVPQTDTGR